MPFYNNIYYPYPSETPGTCSSAGIPSILNSPQSQRSSSIPQQSSVISGPSMTGAHIPSFKFRARRESVDWRRISAIDVDRVASDLDFNTLQENIMGITFCTVENERCPYCQNPVDPVLLKVFRLAQLTVEYLLHSQEYLTSSLQSVEEKLQASILEKEQIKRETMKQNEEIKLLKEELKRRKKIITTQQSMISAGVGNYHKCQHCEKAFMNYSFLQSHVQRRHPEEYDIGVLSEKQKKVQAGKFQDEINKLKEQLNLTRSQLETEQQAYMVRLSQEQENQRTKEDETIKRFEKWKEEEQQKLDGEIEKMREMFMREFKELSVKNAVLENQVLEMKASSLQFKSNTGTVQEDKAPKNEEEKQRYHQELLSLKELLNKQEEKWTAMIQKLQKEHEKEKSQLQSDLKRLQSSVVEEQEVSSSLYRKRIEELGRKLREQNELIITQKEQMKQLGSKLPERTTGTSVAISVAEPVKAKSLTYEQTPTVHILDPIEELSEEDKDSASISEKKKDDNQRLISSLKKNASLTKELRPILEQTLVEKLESLGVKPENRGIPTGQYNTIMTKVYSQRERIAKTFPDFHSVRETLTHNLGLTIKEKRASSSSPVEKKRPDNPPEENQKRARSSSLPSTRVTQVVSKSPGVTEQPPQPAPRSRASTAPKTSTPRTPPFSSEDDSEEESDAKPHQRLKAVQPKAPAVDVSKTVVMSLESETDWTDGSEMEEIDPQLLQHDKSLKVDAGKPVQSSILKEISENLENQPVIGRIQKKPAGGVKVLPSFEDKNVRQELKFSEVDDDDWDVSSMEDDKPSTSKPDKDEAVFTVRKSFESNSSNTSVWGTSTGKGQKGGLHEGDPGSTLKSSLVTVSDWSDSSDI
uniref:Cilium assembly protein DZIP1 n=1 Tax=Lepisosteus oculatus TaxID=7918 RepID=W5MCM1_LEPOC|nr:PREDICTED: zinc finger protein DZIP1 isoform X1 [Lepisosteus oculatus]XP_015219134.1 PREDICTED: zinc finger protein DZIP1 isoform X1 [Lepisosteus oculatus]XP_015219135.1 PREDICTED: zinc finger protein DZIP1 isoform X1 [Lepisosteus oculatus]